MTIGMDRTADSLTLGYLFEPADCFDVAVDGVYSGVHGVYRYVGSVQVAPCFDQLTLVVFGRVPDGYPAFDAYRCRVASGSPSTAMVW